VNTSTGGQHQIASQRDTIRKKDYQYRSAAKMWELKGINPQHQMKDKKEFQKEIVPFKGEER